MKKKHHVRLTDSDVEKLKKLIRKKSTSESMVRRCHILLDMDENHGTVEKTYAQCAQDHGVSPATVRNVVTKCSKEGADAALEYHRNENSNHARRKVDGRMEATLVQIACGPVPEGHSRWTLAMLTSEMKIRFGEDSISLDTVRRTLKKTHLNLIEANTGVSRP